MHSSGKSRERVTVGRWALGALVLLTACSETASTENVRHESASTRGQALVTTRVPPLIRVPFADRGEANLLYKSFREAVVETDYERGFHVLERSEDIVRKLSESGIRYATHRASSDLTRRLQGIDSGGSADSALVIESAAATIPNFPCYTTVEETYSAASDLATQHSQLAQWIDVGDSWQKTVGQGGYDMMVLKLSNAQVVAEKPKLFLTCALHAREYATAALCLDFAEHLVLGHGTDADATWLLDHHEVHVMLHSNPDGRKMAEQGVSWRKNVNQNYCGPSSSLRGADLNRNFEFGWNCCNGSASDPCGLTYHGAGPASEPETQAIQNYMRDLFVDRRDNDLSTPAPDDTSGIFIDVHSYSGLVLWPWGMTAALPPNHAQLQTLGRRLAFFNGYSPEQAISLYPTNGTSDEFAYGELGVASYTFEIGTQFFQDCPTYQNTILPDNLQALLYAAKVARTPYQTPSGPRIVSLESELDGTTAVLSATVDDTAFNNQNGTESVQAIVAVEYTIDDAPWDPAADPAPFVPTDDSFDSPFEGATAAIDTTGLGPGRHTVFVRGQDSGGVWGAVSAIFLDVVDTSCSSDADCDDGQFCNGNETCGSNGSCVAGAVACTNLICDEAGDRCVECSSAADCDDGQFCNGNETCNGQGMCAMNEGPCSSGQCNETIDSCVACLVDGDCDDSIACTSDSCNSQGQCEHVADSGICDDGVFCNGSESCQPQLGCVTSAPPCSGQTCDEAGSRCVECIQDADCDDGIACTVDTCDLAAGTCAFGPDDALCSNGQYCDGEETCHPTLGCRMGEEPCAACDEQGDSCDTSSSCDVATAVDLGPRGSQSVVPADGCVKITQFPSWWQWSSRQGRIDSTGTGSFPVGFTWTQACTGTGGSGTWSGPWNAVPLGTLSENCPVLVELQGSRNIGLVWY